MTPETIKAFHDMEIGISAEHSAVVSADIITAYAQLSGDHNPIHEDAEYAANTRFGHPVAHGMLVAGYVQTALTKLVAPGGVSTSYQFDLLAPAFEGAAITAHAVCAQLDPVAHRAMFAITVVDDTTRKQLISGSAVVAFPKGEK
ncbi:MaoC/PaaZ C-terminal domain-containing protein [Mycobacterium sp. MS1601]|uniref:MaoC/PaaZ C-terminal domain-containing protein n=1 Tax=Mycobacterium sp. MS1601 TaxID=1936029 RepID=UPI0012F881C1|nr:MaoC/PaaZ C-terminal domain-containing protein [Mycobacterium sp. MS1601]